MPELWAAIHTERATLADDLARLDDAQWATPSLCGRWTVEVVVHAQDVRHPLGIERTPAVDALTTVATFFASRNFTVASKTAVAGLELQATDGPFRHGSGPLVRGTTVALVMAMAGREAYCDDLDGPGVPILRDRCRPGGVTLN